MNVASRTISPTVLTTTVTPLIAQKIVEDYVAKLLTVSEAQAAFGFSESTFLRFRQRHRIQLLSGKRVHVDDVIAALDRERRHN